MTYTLEAMYRVAVQSVREVIRSMYNELTAEEKARQSLKEYEEECFASGKYRVETSEGGVEIYLPD